MDATGGQEQRFARAFRLMDEAIQRKVFPGASLAVTPGRRAGGVARLWTIHLCGQLARGEARDGVGSGVADQGDCDDLDGNAAVGAREAGA